MTSERISDELLEQILTSDVATGSSADVGALIWLLATEVAEHRGSEAKLAEIRATVENPHIPREQLRPRLLATLDGQPHESH